MAEEFECKYCKKKFSSEIALNQHVNAKHPMEIKHTEVKKVKIGVGKKHTGLIIGVLVVVIIVGIAYLIFTISGSTSLTGVGPLGSTHEHVAFKVYINGKALDFSQNKYQLRSQFIHVEGGDGDIIHKHATGETLGFFLETVGFRLDSNCITLDTGEKLCNDGNKTLKFYLNNKTSDLFEKYELKDNDRILISYGEENETEMQKQLESIVDVKIRIAGPVTTGVPRHSPPPS